MSAVQPTANDWQNFTTIAGFDRDLKYPRGDAAGGLQRRFPSLMTFWDNGLYRLELRSGDAGTGRELDVVGAPVTLPISPRKVLGTTAAGLRITAYY